MWTLTLGLVLAACAGPAATVQSIATPSAPAPATQTRPPTASPSPSSSTLPPTPQASQKPTSTTASAEPTLATAPRWTERTDVASGPSPREDHTWTVSGDGTVAYLFGGRGANGAVLSDLWQLDLTTDTWSELHPSGNTPLGRFGHTATWVPNVGLVVWSGQGARFFDDIWRYHPQVNAWEQLPSFGAVPEARYGSCASLGPDGEMWISHGFTADDGRFADTSSYSFATGNWTERTPNEGGLPVSRCLHDCFWNSHDQLVLFGGQTTGVQALGDVWAYDLATNQWSQAQTDAGISPRNLYAAALDGDNELIFGGGSLDGGFLGDSWVLNGATLVATPVEYGSPPPARSSATLIYSEPRQRYLLFGGMNADGVLGDLWELSLNT